MAASLPASPGETYRFFQRLGDWNEVTSSAGASVWEAQDLPLRFRLLENANLPDHEGLDAEVWREINRGSIAAWVDVPTAAVGIVLESEVVLADQASDTDGINTIGFSSYEGFVDSWFSGFARSVWQDGKKVGCDIEVTPYYFERTPVDEPDAERRSVRDLYPFITHEMGHCLGLAHTAMNPMWLGRPGPTDWEPGVLPEGIATFQPHPIMSYGSSFRSADLTPDDAHAITLAYPAPGFLESRGAIGGRVVFPSGDPVPTAYVQTVDYSGGSAAFGPGAFTDRRGQFMLEGMRPGPIHVWVRPLIASRAHGTLELAMEAGSLDLVDRQRWFRVRAGEVTLVPDIVVERGRESGQ
ncbi:MAG: hypothetical protein F4Y20_12795 [Acidobacteria bacterium]|nr:hypothetical protein [Acidobacteriota bacterium]MYH21204.1 hypothetical protein [Acidobacteriota bacterium]MYK80049.1 hypothetical protein [Acidobacteriota bacterium]